MEYPQRSFQYNLDTRVLGEGYGDSQWEFYIIITLFRVYEYDKYRLVHNLSLFTLFLAIGMPIYTLNIIIDKRVN